MPTIQLTMAEGRTIDQKREVVEKLTAAACEALRVPPASVEIVILECAKSNLARAGKLVVDTVPPG